MESNTPTFNALDVICQGKRERYKALQNLARCGICEGRETEAIQILNSEIESCRHAIKALELIQARRSEI